jgi:hypothetical protein
MWRIAKQEQFFKKPGFYFIFSPNPPLFWGKAPLINNVFNFFILDFKPGHGF